MTVSAGQLAWAAGAWLCACVAGCGAPQATDAGPRSSYAAAKTVDTRAAEPLAGTNEASQQSAPSEAAAAAAQQPKTEAARTPRRANRLAQETSPYLLLHAHNPVDWYPWGEEALARARSEGKLIFLSIGYSSCYWCHVMERESFMDEEVAAYLNEHFVCIKVDREERPDIDEIYMTALTLLGRRGGWPLTMILTPNALPIYGGTYYPPRDKQVELPGQPEAQTQQMPGLLTLLRVVQQAWDDNPAELRQGAEQLAAAVRRALVGPPELAPRPPGDNIADEVLAELVLRYDERYGGFASGAFEQPKFPEPSNLAFLLELAEHENRPEARRMAEGTLHALAAGGIRDHVGGGFHRYSTERTWSVPHFEKMLYDNAQLASLFARSHALWGHPEHRRVVEELVEFLLREMQSPQGGFYSAIDAETEGEEGAYYVWSAEELRSLLEPEEWDLFAPVYGVDGQPNFEDRYVLRRPQPSSKPLAPAQADALLDERLKPLRQRLLAARSKRERPLVDIKVLCGWNGLAMRGLADAGRYLDQPRYLQAAAQAADFVLSEMRTSEGRLFRVYAGGKAHGTAFLDDYALVVDGLIALHQATADQRWLTAARELQQQQIELFWDEAAGGFFYTPSDHEELFARSKDPVDSALPSGNAVSAANLVYLAEALNEPALHERARQTVLAFATLIERSPASVPRLILAWRMVRKGTENE